MSLETQPGACVVYFVKENTESLDQNPFELNSYGVASVTLCVNGRDYTHNVDRDHLYNVNTYWEMVKITIL